MGCYKKTNEENLKSADQIFLCYGFSTWNKEFISYFTQIIFSLYGICLKYVKKSIFNLIISNKRNIEKNFLFIININFKMEEALREETSENLPKLQTREINRGSTTEVYSVNS